VRETAKEKVSYFIAYTLISKGSYCLVGERTRIINRMKATLARLGIRNFKPTLRKHPRLPPIASTRVADRRENGENADLAPLGDQRRCSPAAADWRHWPGFAFALTRVA
jgi:hypothetical protein